MSGAASYVALAGLATTMIGVAATMAVDRFLPLWLQRATWPVAMLSSIAIGILIIDRGYGRKMRPITAAYVAGLLFHVLASFFVFYHVLFWLAAFQGRVDL